MAWTYDTTLAKEKDQVRFLVHDTDTNRQLFQDEEIDWVITQEANIYMAAAQLCEIVVARAGDVRSKKVGDLSITYDEKFYRGLAVTLRARGAGHQVPYAAGISVSDKQVQQQDTDATKPSFFRRLQDNPGAPSTSMPPSPDDPLTTI